MSFLQRRISEQARKEAEQRSPLDMSPPVPPPEEPPKPEPKPEVKVEHPAESAPVEKIRLSAKLTTLRKQIRPKLLATPDEADQWNRGDAEKEALLVGRLKTILQKMNLPLSAEEFESLKEAVLNDLMGFGAIEPLVQSKSISEIMVTGADMIFAEQKGKLRENEIVFDDEDHVQWTAQRIVRPLGRVFNRANPMVDARLPDGSRVEQEG
jgi:pilus assembly protein CpaF